MAYGKFMTVIKKVDMFKNHLRLIVGNVEDENDKHVLLDPIEAQQLATDIINELDTHHQYMSSDYVKRWGKTTGYDSKGNALHDTK